jgi:protein TonB
VVLPFELIDGLERIAVENFRSIEALGSEIGGLLFGGADDGDSSTILIEDFEPVACDYSRGPFYRLSEADLARFDAAIEKRGGAANARVAGLFRSHSRKGLSLDEEDMKTMKARFGAPWQIALLLRPFATKVSAGGIFIWEDGQMRSESSYLEFPFRSSELGEGGSAGPAEETPAANAKPAMRAAVVPMPSRLKMARPSTAAPVTEWAAPAPPATPDFPPAPAVKGDETVAEAIPPAAIQPAKALEPPKPAAPPVETAAAAEVAPIETPAETGGKRPRGVLLWAAIAAALAACSGALFVYPGLMRRHAPPPPAALTLRIEHTATDLLLTWNRDSEAVRNAKKAVLSITDGERQENLDLNLADLRNGSIVYSPLSGDVSFRMEVTGADQSKTASESVRVLRTKPSPMPDTSGAAPAKVGSAPAADSANAGAAPAEETAAADTPAPRHAQARTFAVASLAERVRSALPTDLPDAPALGNGPGAAAPVNLGALGSAGITMIARPAAPPAESNATPEPARDIRQPELTSHVNPTYPDLARQHGVSGTVALSVVIGANGKITNVKALSGPELLRGAAMDAVKQWVYSPMTVNGHAVETSKEIDLNFSLGH